MKKLLALIGISAVASAAIIPLTTVNTTNTNQNINQSSLGVVQNDISVGNGETRGLDRAKYYAFTIESLFATEITGSAIDILNSKGIDIKGSHDMFDLVSLENMATGNAITEQDVSNNFRGANTVYMNVTLKTNELSESMGLTGEMHFTYYLNFKGIDLTNSVLTNFVLTEYYAKSWVSAISLRDLVVQANIWVYEQVVSTSDILIYSPFAQNNIDHYTTRPVFVASTGEKFTDEMLTNMKNGEKIELKYNYFANEQGVAKGITGSTMIKITFEKGK